MPYWWITFRNHLATVDRYCGGHLKLHTANDLYTASWQKWLLVLKCRSPLVHCSGLLHISTVVPSLFTILVPANPVSCGVPQGLVLGQILFLLYTADLQQLIQQHALHPHGYADGTQIYGFSLPITTSLQSTDCVRRWSRCVINLAKHIEDGGSVLFNGS